MNEILALVSMNGGEAVVLRDRPEFSYNMYGDQIIGVDKTGLLVKSYIYIYDKPTPGFYAFGGHKFEIKLIDGRVIECYGQYWDGGYKNAEMILGVKIESVPYETKEELKECYVFCGGNAITEKLKLLKEEYKEKDGNVVYEYREYEKMINNEKEG